MSAICGACGRTVRVTKQGSLSKHASHYATTCDNTGIANVEEAKIR